MLPTISKDQAKWLVETFAPIRGGRVDNSTFGMFLKAYNILKATDRKVGCFSCEGRSIAAMANSIYSQYEEDIKAIAYPVKKTRKKNV